MAELADNDHFFEEITLEPPGTIRRNIIRRLGLASQVAEAIRSPNNNTSAWWEDRVSIDLIQLAAFIIHLFTLVL